MASRKENAEEDLAIQNTLVLSVEERLELLANIIVTRIIEDKKAGEPLFKKIQGQANV